MKMEQMLSLLKLNAEDDSQVMKGTNAVRITDGSFVYIDWNREVELDDFSELES